MDAITTTRRGAAARAWPGLLLVAGLLVAFPGGGWAEDCAGLAVTPAPGLDDPAACAAVPLADSTPPTRVVAVAQAPDRLVVAVVPAAGGAPLAGPAEAEVLAVDPLRSPGLAIVPDRWLGGQGIAVVVSNSYANTGRSMATRSLHLFVRADGRLRPVFATYLEAEYSGTTACPGRRGATCRRSWTRRYALSAGPGPAGTPPLPVLTVTDARSGRVLSVHRPGPDGYAPPLFDNLPPFAEP